MTYQPQSVYQLLPGVDYSAYSRPRRERPDGSYEIHLIKSDDPDYLPPDAEIWPLYQQAILGVLRHYPEAHQAAVDAYKKLKLELQGRENRDVPPGSRPQW